MEQAFRPAVPPVFELLDHTADIGFRTWGSTLPELFENAAHALVSFAEPAATAGCERTVDLKADDDESLLVAWLSEVLYLLDSGTMVPSQFTVRAVQDHRINATVAGRAGHGQWRLIVKAVTYHQIEVTQRGGRWEATVYLDV